MVHQNLHCRSTAPSFEKNELRNRVNEARASLAHDLLATNFQRTRSVLVRRSRYRRVKIKQEILHRDPVIGRTWKELSLRFTLQIRWTLRLFSFSRLLFARFSSPNAIAVAVKPLVKNEKYVDRLNARLPSLRRSIFVTIKVIHTHTHTVDTLDSRW